MYFVVLRGQGGQPLPMTTDRYDDDLAMFASEEDAIAAAEANMLGAAYGFKVYEW